MGFSERRGGQLNLGWLPAFSVWLHQCVPTQAYSDNVQVVYNLNPVSRQRSVRHGKPSRGGGVWQSTTPRLGRQHQRRQQAPAALGSSIDRRPRLSRKPRRAYHDMSDAELLADAATHNASAATHNASAATLNASAAMLVLQLIRGEPQNGICGSILGDDYPCDYRERAGPLVTHPDLSACQVASRTAPRLCGADPRCFAIVLNVEGSVATLKKRYAWPPEELLHPRNHKRVCQTLSEMPWSPLTPQQEARGSMARRVFTTPSAEWLGGLPVLRCASWRNSRWQARGCIDYTRPSPQWGAPTAIVKSRHLHRHAKQELLVITFIERPGKGSCRMLRSAARFGIPLIVLGWDPHGSHRFHEFYLGSKIVMLAAFLERYILNDDAIVIYVDGTDTLFQQNAARLHERATSLLARSSSAAIIFSAEANCYPPHVRPWFSRRFDEKHTRASVRHSESRPPIFKFLNSGGFVGMAHGVRVMLKAYLERVDNRTNDNMHSSNATLTSGVEAVQATKVARRKENISAALQLHAQRSLYYPDLSIVYKTNDQAVFAELFVAMGGGSNGSALRMDLDYATQLFLPMFSSTPSRNLAVEDGHRVRNCISRTTPAILHYNGGYGSLPPQEAWFTGYEADNLLCHTLRLAPARTNRTLGRYVFGAYSPDFTWQRLALHDVCGIEPNSHGANCKEGFRPFCEKPPSPPPSHAPPPPMAMQEQA